MAVLSWTADLDDGERLIRRCLAAIDLAIDEEISNQHQIFARDQGPGKLVHGQVLSVLASRASSHSSLYRFEVRSGESALVRNSRCEEIAAAVKAGLARLQASPC